MCIFHMLNTFLLLSVGMEMAISWLDFHTVILLSFPHTSVRLVKSCFKPTIIKTAWLASLSHSLLTRLHPVETTGKCLLVCTRPYNRCCHMPHIPSGETDRLGQLLKPICMYKTIIQYVTLDHKPKT